jgi:Heterokaryon incompatibility protein (HET)
LVLLIFGVSVIAHYLQDDPSAKYIKGRPINIHPGSKDSLSGVYEWFDACHQNHPACHSNVQACAPKRLIEVFYENGQRLLKLISSDTSKHVNYAAVSYCWGGPQSLIATHRNMHLLMNKFSFKILPKTLQDCVLVAESLGIHYLWIDALCIIQETDDPLDIEERVNELRLMGEIYENAVVTIAASRASSVEAGFLHSRLPAGSAHSDSIFKVPYKHDLTERGSVFLVPSEPERNEPLDNRAWAMQERLLSRRLLDFGSRQTRWVCHDSRLNITIDGWEPDLIRNSERGFHMFQEFQDINSNLDKIQAGDTWRKLVTTYSARQITRSTDRLPAIAALSKRFMPHLGPKYLAGLWLSQLPVELLWEPSFEDLQLRPREYLGPSWSWVSINRPVRHKSYKEYIGEDEQTFDLPNFDVEFQVLNHEVQLRWPDFEFGEVKAAEINLKARYRKARWAPGDQYQKSKQIGTLSKRSAKSILPAHFLVDGHSFEFNFAAIDSATQVYLMVLVVEPDTSFSISEGYSMPVQEDTGPGADHSDDERILRGAELNRSESMESQHYQISSRPVISIKGLVLHEVSPGCFARLGVFEFDHHYSKAWKSQLDDATVKWNDRFQEFHQHTKWMIEGGPRTFRLI